LGIFLMLTLSSIGGSAMQDNQGGSAKYSWL
jgi:hypothetical protein